MRSFLSGILGGLLIIAISTILLFTTDNSLFSVRVINPNNYYGYKGNYSMKMKILQELEDEGVLLTPQEFTSNIVNYYNTALTLMAALLVVFSIFGYFHLKFLSEDQIKKSLETIVKSSDFNEVINNSIFGKAEDKFASNEKLSELSNEILMIKERLTKIDESNIDQQIIETNGS